MEMGCLTMCLVIRMLLTLTFPIQRLFLHLQECGRVFLAALGPEQGLEDDRPFEAGQKVVEADLGRVPSI